MRISTVQMQNRGVDAILEHQSDLSYTQQQLSSGKRILTPSDDVMGSTQILAFNEVIDTYTQYQENADYAENNLQLQEGSYTHVIEVFQRINELAVQSSNVNYSAGERALLAKEVRVLLDDVVSVANSVDANGDYLFAGFNVDTAPIVVTEVPAGSGLYDYTYTGDQGQKNLQIGETRFIGVNDNGQDVFMNVPESGGGTQNIFETLEQFALDLEAGAISPTIEADVALAMDHLAAYRAQNGARQNAIESRRILNDTIVYQGQKMLSEIEDLDYAEAVSRLNLQLTELEASQQSFLKIQNLSLFNFL